LYHSIRHFFHAGNPFQNKHNNHDLNLEVIALLIKRFHPQNLIRKSYLHYPVTGHLTIFGGLVGYQRKVSWETWHHWTFPVKLWLNNYLLFYDRADISFTASLKELLLNADSNSSLLIAKVSDLDMH